MSLQYNKQAAGGRGSWQCLVLAVYCLRAELPYGRQACCCLLLTFFCSNAFGQCSVSNCGTTNVSCNGAANGQACVSISGGTGPYNYVWSTGASTTGTAATFNALNGLSGGTGTCPNCGDTVYTVTVTDALGCVDSASFTITEGPVLTGAVDSVRNVSCFGACDGRIYVSACGGTCPSSSLYLWSDGQTTPIADNLCAGNYSVRITASGAGCDTIYLTNITVTEPLQLTATTGSNPPCTTTNDGNATVSPADGTFPYNYLWSASANNQTTQTATGLSSNTYTVTVTDANLCDTTVSVTVTAKITANLSSTQDARCEGVCDGYARAVASGGTLSYTYSWSPSPGGGTPDSATGLCANTNYTLTVRDANNCSSNASFTPIALTTLTNSITETPVNCGENDGTATANISGGASPYSYSWSPSGGVSAAATGLSRGTYTVTISDNSGCTIKDTVIITEFCEIKPYNTFTPNGDGINDTWTIENIDLYPDCEVKIYNRWGDIVLNQAGYGTGSEWGEGSSEASVSTLPSAVYYYVIDLKDGSPVISGSVTIVR